MRRIQQIANEPSVQSLIDRLIEVAKTGLPAMFDGDRAGFVHSLHRDAASDSLRPVGESVRYGAMAALGARWLEDSEQRRIFGGETVSREEESVGIGEECCEEKSHNCSIQP